VDPERTSLFAKDYPDRATREQARIVSSEVETQLNDSHEAEAIRNAIVPIMRDFELRTNPADDVRNYSAFPEELEGLRFAWRIVESGIGSGLQPKPQPTEREWSVGKRRAP
jgi:hypothetical protein